MLYGTTSLDQTPLRAEIQRCGNRSGNTSTWGLLSNSKLTGQPLMVTYNGRTFCEVSTLIQHIGPSKAHAHAALLLVLCMLAARPVTTTVHLLSAHCAAGGCGQGQLPTETSWGGQALARAFPAQARPDVAQDALHARADGLHGRPRARLLLPALLDQRQHLQPQPASLLEPHQSLCT